MTIKQGRRQENFQGGATEKARPKNNTIKPSYILPVPCMKIQGGYGPPCPSYKMCKHLL